MKKTHKNLHEALAAALSAPDANSAHAVYEELPGYEPESEGDLRQVYERMKAVRKRQGNAKDPEQAKEQMMYLSFIIAKSTSPKFHPLIARLLEDEFDSIPSRHLGLFGALTRSDETEQKIRYGPAMALLSACAGGKIREALPILRRIRDKGGMISSSANSVIGAIGAPEDIAYAIELIKKDPENAPALNPYGPAALPLLIQEIDNPANSEATKRELALRLDHVVEPGNCEPILRLLDHPMPFLAGRAEFALIHCLRKSNVSLILSLLDDKRRGVRFQALNSLANQAWDDRHVPRVVRILESDPDEGMRVAAADVLAERGPASVKPALRRALQDKSPKVRSEAQGALEFMARHPRKE